HTILVSDWSSDVCSSDLKDERARVPNQRHARRGLPRRRRLSLVAPDSLYLIPSSMPSCVNSLGKTRKKISRGSRRRDPCSDANEIGRASCRERWEGAEGV